MRKIKMLVGLAVVAGGLLLAATSVSAQTTPPGASPGAGAGFCPGFNVNGSGGFGMMGGNGRGVGAIGIEHQAIAGALGLSDEQLTQSLAAGTSVAQLAAQKGVALDKVLDAALGAHQAQWDAMVKDGYMSQAQIDLMKNFMRERIAAQFQATPTAARGYGMMGGPGMMGGYGMMGPGGFGRGLP